MLKRRGWQDHGDRVELRVVVAVLGWAEAADAKARLTCLFSGPGSGLRSPGVCFSVAATLNCKDADYGIECTVTVIHPLSP